MKFLAILKDSFREALDSMVFYVMLGISCLVILVVASISFRPVSANEAFAQIAGEFGIVRAYRGKSLLKDHFAIHPVVENLRLLNDASEPYRGDYSFTIDVDSASLRKAVTFWSKPGKFAAPREAQQEAADPVSDQLTEEFVKHQLARIDIVKLTRDAGAPKGITRFAIETRGVAVDRSWAHQPTLFFGSFPLQDRRSLGFCVYWIEDILVNTVGAWIGILTSIIITAFFIPNMLRKGTVDLLLSKPIGRSVLLFYKFIGGLTFMFVNASIAIGGVWLVLGLRTGIWAPGFLQSILVLTFFFAILYSISTLIAVLTRSVVIAILLTCLSWGIMFVVGYVHLIFAVMKMERGITESVPEWLSMLVNGLHAILPRTKDLDILITKILSQSLLSAEESQRVQHANIFDSLIELNWGESLTVSGLFIAVMLGLACWRFATRDY